MSDRWTRWALVFGVVVAMTAAVGCGDETPGGEEDPACTTDEDCADDEICDLETNTCVEDPEVDNDNDGQNQNDNDGDNDNDGENQNDNDGQNDDANQNDNDGEDDDWRRDDGPYDEDCVFDDRDDTFEPDQLWSFEVDDSMPYAEYEGHGGDEVYAGHAINQVMMTPVVVDLEGQADDEVPDVIFTSFATSETEDDFSMLVTGVLRAISGDDGSHRWSVGYEELADEMGIDEQDRSPTLGFMPAGSIAAGDIDGDGTPEIVAPIWDFHDGPQGLAAVEADGSVLWVSDAIDPVDIEFWWGGPSITDLNGDGEPEIVVGSVVYDSEGQFMWDGRDVSGLETDLTTGSNFSVDEPARIGPLSVAADVDGDGNREVVTGRTTFNHDGTLAWEAGFGPDGELLEEGYPGVADFNDNGAAEVVVVSAGTVRIHDGLDGELVWGPVDVPDSGRLGPPTVADMTGDDRREIGVAGANGYFVLEVDYGQPGYDENPDYQDVKVWEQDTQDVSSNTTGSSVFDFNGDGEASVIYNDELYLRVFDGETGDIIFEAENPSYTALENPVIADVDNAGTANIIVPTSDYECGSMIEGCEQGEAGVQAFRDADDNWVTTRRIWNQHPYSINHVEEDGTIPTDPTPNYLDHNTFRLNTLTEIAPQAAPDLYPEDPDFSADGCDIEVDVWVANGGAIQVGPELPVSVYAIDEDGERHLLETAETMIGLAPGESERIVVETELPGPGDWDVVVVVDDDDGESTRNECNEDNNELVLAEFVECE